MSSEFKIEIIVTSSPSKRSCIKPCWLSIISVTSINDSISSNLLLRSLLELINLISSCLILIEFSNWNLRFKIVLISFFDNLISSGITIYPIDIWFIAIENSFIASLESKSRKVFISLFFSEPFSKSIMFSFDIRLTGKSEIKKFCNPKDLIKDFFEKKTSCSDSRPFNDFA